MGCEYSPLQRASTNFMRKVARNTVTEYIREMRKHEHEELTEDCFDVSVWMDKDPFDDEYISVIYKRLRIDVPKEMYLRCFERLDKEEMSIIHGYYFLKMSDKQIGEMLSIARTTAQSRRYAVEKKLRRYIIEECTDI